MQVGRKIFSYKAGHLNLRFGFAHTEVSGKGHSMHRRARAKVAAGLIELGSSNVPTVIPREPGKPSAVPETVVPQVEQTLASASGHFHPNDIRNAPFLIYTADSSKYAATPNALPVRFLHKVQ
jgi:hypothetical protein